MTVSIVAYGLGNLGSVANMLKRVGTEAKLVSSPSEIDESERLLLPGVGAFDKGMGLLKESGLIDPIREFAQLGKPLLGICLGMQLLFDGSDEGEMGGLGILHGKSRKFQANSGVRVPHMGWNSVQLTRSDPLTDALPAESRFYFVHSYYVAPDIASEVLGYTDYGNPFASMVKSGNVMGVQFHPEKSHDFGKRVLGNFAEL